MGAEPRGSRSRGGRLRRGRRNVDSTRPLPGRAGSRGASGLVSEPRVRRLCRRRQLPGQVFVPSHHRQLRQRPPARLRGIQHRVIGLAFASQHSWL